MRNVCDVFDERVFTMLRKWQDRKTGTCVVFDERVFTTLHKWQDRKMCRTRDMSVMAVFTKLYTTKKKMQGDLKVWKLCKYYNLWVSVKIMLRKDIFCFKFELFRVQPF